MATELRKLILEIDDIPEEVVPIPEWGDAKVLVRGMNGKDRANFLKRATDHNGDIAYDRFYPELIIATVFDPESRTKLFEPADRDALNEKSGAALERIARSAQKLSGLGSEDVEEAKKDSAETENSGST